jgi:hypothetical protein
MADAISCSLVQLTAFVCNVAIDNTNTFEKCVIIGAINYYKIMKIFDKIEKSKNQGVT